MRPEAALVALILLAVPAAPLASAHHTAPLPADEITTVHGDDRLGWRAVAFAPDGSHALLVGKWDDGEVSKEVIGRWTPEAGLEIVRNTTGPGLVDVSFHESGTSLIVGLKDTILLGQPGSYRNVWNDTEFADRELTFYGLRGDFEPRAETALVAGSSLLSVHLNGSIEVLHGGRGAFFRSMDWNPATPLTAPFAWVEAAVEREGRALLGTLWRTNGSGSLGEDDNVAIYGKANRGKALLNTIAFAPNGTFAAMAGRDGVGASILTWSSHRASCHEHADREACHDHRWQYLPTDKRQGDVTCIAWHPEDGYALTVGLDKDTVGVLDPHVYVPLLHQGPDLFGCDYHPSGAYALAAGANGTLMRITPGPAPLGTVVHPAPGSLVAPHENASFVVGGLPRAPGQALELTASVPGTSANTTVVAEGPWWQVTVDASDLEDGTHQLQLTLSAGQSSSTFTHPFLVNNQAFTPPSPTMLAPRGLEGSGSDADGRFTLRWAPVDAPVVYEVEEQRIEGGVNATRTLRAGTSTNLTVQVEADGSYLYKVRARNAFNASDWSRSTVVNVILDSDGDGVPNSKDPRPYVADTWGDEDGDGVDTDVELRQCSDPSDPASTPATDDDGDGLRNGEECLQGTDPKDAGDPPDEPEAPDEEPGGTDQDPDAADGNDTPGLAASVVALTGLLVALARRRR